MASSGVSHGSKQIINGVDYDMYTPAWYSAMQAEAQRAAGAQGTAAGTQARATLDAFGAGGGSGLGGNGSLSGLQAAASGSGGGGGGLGGPGAQVSGVPTIDTTAASNAAFSGAKDTVGNTARASLTALRNELGSTGALGGGAEHQGVRDIIQYGQGQLGNVANQQAIKETDTAQENARTNYAGAITQRGQDISLQEANARLAQQQNQLEWQKQMQLLQMAFSGLNSAAQPSSGLY